MRIVVVAAAISLSVVGLSAAQSSRASGDSFRLAEADQTGGEGNERNQPALLDEVVVTATKLGQPARTVAGSVEVTTGAELDALGAQSFEDYLTRTPGVVFNAGAPGLSTAVIRGVSTTTSLDQEIGRASCRERV